MRYKFDEEQNNNKGVSIGYVLAVAGVIAATVVVFGAVIFLRLILPRMNYQVQVDEFAYERLATEPAPLVPVNILFSEENILKYEQGKGITVKFLVHNDPEFNYDTSEKIFSLKPWGKLYETDRPSRNAYVAEQKAAFEEAMMWFQRQRHLSYIFEIYVDDTEGIYPSLREKVDSVVDSLNIRALAQAGHGVEVCFARLSGTTFVQSKASAIPTQADAQENENGIADIESAKRWVLRDEGEKSESSIFLGFFRAARENTGKPNRHIHIISDFLENTSYTVSFYTDESVEDSASWPELKTKILQGQEVPQILTGATVDLHVPPPPREKYKKHKQLDPLILRAQQFWAYTLKQAGGANTVRLH